MAGLKGPHGPLKAGLRNILLGATSASSPVSASVTSTLPSTGTVGSAISFTYTSANATVLYLAVMQGGAQVSRTALPSTSGSGSFTPGAVGTTQVALYGVASGGSALYTSASIAISAVATSASFTAGAVPTTATVGQALTGIAYTSSNIAAGALYWRALRNGASSSSPIALATITGTLPSYTPADYTPGSTWSVMFQLTDVTGNTIYASTGPITVAEPVSRTLALNYPTIAAGNTWSGSGTLSNYTVQPALSISVDGATAIAMTSASPYLLAFSPSTGAPTGFTFTGQALSAGNHSVEVLDTTNGLTTTITATATAAGSSGGTTTPGAPGSLPAFHVQANTTMAVGSPITLGHFFAKGVVPSGQFQNLTATVNGQTTSVQVDQSNAWLADGSLRFAALSLLTPVAVAAGQVASVQLGLGTAALSGSPITTAQMLAAGDFSIQVAGGADYGGSSSTSGAIPPSAGSFTGVNNSTLTVSGGGSSPLVLSQTYGTANNVASQVQSLSGAPQTFTAIVSVANFVGYAEGGITLRNSGSGQQATFSIFCPNSGPLNLLVNLFSNITTNSGQVGSTTTGLSYLNGNFFLRVAFDGSNYSFLASPSGASNSWVQVAQQTASAVFSPNQIGFFLCANSAGATTPGNAQLTVSDWEVASGANLQGAATANISTATVAFAASAQDVLTNFTQSTGAVGWGTSYPVGGWEMVRSGPVCSEFRAWRYLKRVSDGAAHGMVKAKLYVRAWSNGSGGIQGYEVLSGLFQENSFGALPGATTGTALKTYQIASATVEQGSAAIASFGALYSNPQRGWWGANSDGSRPWISNTGAAKPSYMVAHDQTYAIGTLCIPPYDTAAVSALIAAGANLNMTASTPGYGTYSPNVSNFSNSLTAPGAINATGDGATDPRYGFLNCNSAALFLNPLDSRRYVSVLADGWGWADWEFWVGDERTGCPVNPGTTAGICPSPPNSSFVMYGSGGSGSPAWQGFGAAYPGTYHSFNYGSKWDNSHTPSLWIMPLLLTGDAAFEETAVFQSSGTLSGYAEGETNWVFGGVQYDLVATGYDAMDGAERAGANAIRQSGRATA